jgi:hypothetical protein
MTTCRPRNTEAADVLLWTAWSIYIEMEMHRGTKGCFLKTVFKNFTDYANIETEMAYI